MAERYWGMLRYRLTRRPMLLEWQSNVLSFNNNRTLQKYFILVYHGYGVSLLTLTRQTLISLRTKAVAKLFKSIPVYLIWLKPSNPRFVSKSRVYRIRIRQCSLSNHQSRLHRICETIKRCYFGLKFLSVCSIGLVKAINTSLLCHAARRSVEISTTGLLFNALLVNKYDNFFKFAIELHLKWYCSCYWPAFKIFAP